MVEGELIFETQDGSALYPFECPQLMRIRWLSRDKGENLKDETSGSTFFTDHSMANQN